MLLINSMITTVFPTLPPKAPTFPPLIEWADQIIDLDSCFKNISLSIFDPTMRVLVYELVGFLHSTGPLLSTVSPITLKIRPSTFSPTGTEIGAPELITSIPCLQTFSRGHGNRSHPIFYPNAVGFLKPVVTLYRNLKVYRRLREHHRFLGWNRRNSASTTAPMTWTIFPLFDSELSISDFERGLENN